MKWFFTFFLFPLQIFAQDITGVWTGTMYNDTTKQFIKYEVAISNYEGKLSGYSHTIFMIDSVENIGVKSLKIKKSGNNLFIEDDKLIYNNYSEPPAKGVKTYSQLTLSQSDTVFTLSGLWKTNKTKLYSSLTGNIYLQKKNDYKKSYIIPKLDSLGVTWSLSFIASQLKQNTEAAYKREAILKTKQSKVPIVDNKLTESNSSSKIFASQNNSATKLAATAITTRQIETVKSVEIKSDSLLLTLYDNGEIDGDTVSVLLNGKIIMPMQGLTANGTSKTIYLSPEMGDSIVLIMYAENLGSIPPNTGLLVLHDGKDIYEIRFTGDFQKNSAIILRRKKKT